jgi:predicted transcriptional regulator
MRRRTSGPAPEGLAALRRGGTVTELLFLFECESEEVYRLQPVADRLGLTIQAVSHLFRQLRTRGFVQFREGRYRPTIAGIAWLHALLTSLEEDTSRRRARLSIVKTTRAIAASDLPPGASVSLELENGILFARLGPAGGSRGRVARGGAAGTLVDVSELTGIVPIAPATIRIRTLPERDLGDPRLGQRIGRELADETGVVAAVGLEAYHAARESTPRPLLRFGVAGATREASQLGVSSTVVVLDRDLPRLLSSYLGAHALPLDVAPLSGSRASGHSRRARRSTLRRPTGSR